jgi:catechol 2,3-dioxygenase-like lactoylglutathione lyase family enzyme
MKLAVFVLFAAIALAQIPPPNAAGVSMGHHHIMVPNPAAHEKIWVDVLGGQASGNAPLRFIKLPGAFLILSQANPTGGSENSAIDHFAFAAKDYNGTRDKLAAAGVTIVRDRQEGQREFVAMFPDGIKVEFYEDTSIATPIAHHHIHFSTTDPTALRDWYVRAFGAEVKTEGTRTIVSIPGSMLSFRRVDQAAPPTRGRSLDHTGVNVKNVNEYCEKLAGMGITCERPMGTNTPIAMVTDPAGARIEINQGLEAR